jgi:CRISPR-associated protein (TIGR03986 family)
MAEPRNQNTQRRRPAGGGGGFRPGAGRPERRIEPGPCPDSLDVLKSRFEQIPAPYNFVPLAPWVHVADSRRLVSLDMPFRDGACGEIPFTLVADTPILIGAEQDKPRPGENRPGEVHFVKAPDSETYLVPGSALRGMLRSVIEIAGFGRLRQVDDHRYGLRDITRADTPYARAVNREIHAGFLRRGPGGVRELVPCRWAKLGHADLERWWQVRLPIFRRGMGVADKYRLWGDICRRNGINNPLAIACTIDGDRVSALSGSTIAYPVLTGQINDRDRDRNAKQNDFVFYDRNEDATIQVADADWRAFLLIHGDQDGERAGNASWPSHWRACFNRDEEIPVFWINDGVRHDERRVRLGLARMPKLAWDWSIHELIEHTDAAHLKGPEQGEGYDLADLLFGALADAPGRILKGRVSLGNAPVEPVNGESPCPERHGPTILNGPKPTYYPNYIRQQTDADGRLASRDYATCIRANAADRPEIRGQKRYPVRPVAAVQPLTPEQAQGSQAVATILHPLPAGTRFSGRILFHNLRPFELGALIWALTWGNNDRLRHSLGMGKPFGLGQVHFEIDWRATRLRRNTAIDRPPVPIEPAETCADFTAHMQTAYGEGRLPGTWQDSPQLRALLAMADPAAGEFPAELRHMRLQRCIDPARGRPAAYNEFVWAKQKQLALMEYDATSRAANATQRQQRPTGPGGAARQGPGGSQPGPRGIRGHQPARQAGAIRSSTPPHAAPQVDQPWLAAKVAEIQQANHAQQEEVIGGKLLARAWRQIEDPAEKAAVLAAIKTLWHDKGWWDDPPGKGKRQVKAMYESD